MQFLKHRRYTSVSTGISYNSSIMGKKPPDMSKVMELHKTTFADILNMFGQGKIRIKSHAQILD